MIYMIVILFIFIGLGLLFINGKGADLIAGYNTLSDQEKAHINEKALLQFMGKMMFIFSFSVLLWTLDLYLGYIWLFYVGLIIFIVTFVFLIYTASVKDHFKQ